MDKFNLQVDKQKNTKTIETMGAVRISLYLSFGVILPCGALIANYIIDYWLKDLGFNMLYMVGAMFLLPRPAYLYVTVGTGTLVMLLWLVFFRKKVKKYNGFIAGILLFNAFFDLAFGFAAIVRFLVIPVWLLPFCAAPVLFLSSIKAMRKAGSMMSKKHVVLTTVAGFIFAVMLSLFVVKQPWGLIEHLPNAQGANLSRMDLSHIFIERGLSVTFEEADLSYVDLSDAFLGHGPLNMHKAKLYGANLNNTVLCVVNLTEADLRNVNMDNASIFEVDFTGANFNGASLGFYSTGRVYMTDANLCGADLREIKNIEGVNNWEGAIYNSATLWPEDFNHIEKRTVFLGDKNTRKTN